jgi:hypothetical protein
MNNLEIIRRACIKANPSILELKFGCEVERFVGEIDTFVKLACWRDKNVAVFYRKSKNGKVDQLFNFEPTDDEIQNWKILGRPIRLSDVLLALQKANKNISIQDYGCFMWFGNPDKNDPCEIEGWNEIFGDKRITWDLKNDNLESQSEETIKFLANLLVMEGK